MRFYKPQKGVTLPTLTKPAGPADIVLDKEAINVSGQKLVGKLDIAQAVTVNGNVEIPLQTFDVIDGSKGLKVAGSLGNATAADIVKGKNAFTDAGFVEGTLEATGGEPSYTLQIKTENYSDGTDSIIYFSPGDSMKSFLNLTTSYQSITCGDFICIKRGSIDNVMSGIDLYNGADSELLSIGPGSPNIKYAVDLKANGGYTTINIRALMRDFPTVAKISLNYMQS